MLQQAQACVFEGPGKPLQPRLVPLPTLSAGELLVRVELATICGSDLHSYSGRREVPVPTILGHEILGTIVDMGPHASPGVDAVGQPLALGDRVTWSLVVSCGSCFFCESGLPEKCVRVLKYGHERMTDAWSLSGGLASHCHLIKGTHVFRLPNGLPSAVACPASCATATVAAALRHAGELSGQVILIQGAGMLGLTAAAWARTAGAREVIVADPSPSRLEAAHVFGAHAVFTPDSEALRRHIRGVSEGRGADTVLELSGAADAIMLGIDLLRVGGKAIWVGAVFPTVASNFIAERVVRKYLSIQGVHNYRPADLAAALDFLQAHHRSFPFAEQVSRPFPLADAPTAFDYARQGACLRVAIGDV